MVMINIGKMHNHQPSSSSFSSASKGSLPNTRKYGLLELSELGDILNAYIAKFKHLSHCLFHISMYLLIHLFKRACEFSNLEFPFGKYTIVNLCSVFNLCNTSLIVSFLNSISLSVRMNCDGPIHGRMVSIYECMTSSADFNLIGIAIKYEECRSKQVKIHLNPLLICSNGPTQSKHIPLKGLCGNGKCLLSYLTL